MCGLCGSPEEAAAKSPYNPFFAIVSESQDYAGPGGVKVGRDEIDLTSRLLFMLRMHKAYPITGTVATGAALRIPGSVVWDVLREEAKTRTEVYIGHPSGRIPVESEVTADGGRIELKKACVYRTARRIMDGIVYLPER